MGIEIITVQKKYHDTAGSNLNASSIFANGQAVWLVAVCVGAGMCFCRPAENFCFWSSILYLARKNHDSFARWTAKAENYSRSRVLILAEGN
jgi:hypothetical protein